MQSLICDHKEELCMLHEKVSSLEVFLKNFEKSNVSGEMTDLEVRIKEVASVAEHTIQLRLIEAVVADDEMQKEKAHERLCDSLKQVAEDIDCVQKESKEIQDKGKQSSKESSVQDSSSVKVILNDKNNMVGRHDERERMLAELTRGLSGELKVIPIVGMGGIGKTTLAKEVYDDASIRSHFDVRAWATISQQHNVKDILVSLLRPTKGDTSYMDDEPDLADKLQKSLKGKRYLIVLDDMWKSEAWDDVRLCFPSENNGSRILLTTRNTEVACSACTYNLSLQMGFMDPDESWNLFESIAFANEALPSEFETIGKQIVDKCHGLPLTIVLIAGLLESKRTTEYWENVAKDFKSITNDTDKQCLQVLELSYNHLTGDLKACLLYFAIFPEDSEIPVKKLMRLWMAEGFLKLGNDLEGEAEKCLQDLIGRCLVLVSEKNWDETKIRSCKVHDLIYELCSREAQRQNVFVMNDFVPNNVDVDEDLDEYLELAMHSLKPFKRWTGNFIINLRALLTPGYQHLIGTKTDDEDNNFLTQTRIRSILSLHPGFYTFELDEDIFSFFLIRILDLSFIMLTDFPSKIPHLIWLRYLELYSSKGILELPPEIRYLWNLHTFIIIGDYVYTEFPEQIWELAQLRHLRVYGFNLPNPPSVFVEERRFGIRNVKKLRTIGGYDDYVHFVESRFFDNLSHLHQLEALSFQLWIPPWTMDVMNIKCLPMIIPNANTLPATLKKLKLWGTCLRWEDLNIIGELPNLEVLKLFAACIGEEWCPTEGGFTRLKNLLFAYNDLKYWKATNDSFPVLECLLIRDCSYLQEIPIEFADINSLQLIKLIDCSPKLKASVVQIQREQEDIGNKPVDVRILQYDGASFTQIVCDSGSLRYHDMQNNYQRYHEEFIQNQPINDQGRPIQPSQEESMDMWLKAAGDVHKGRVYGLGSECSVSRQTSGFLGASSSSSVNQDEFQLLHKKLADNNELYLKEKAAREEEEKRRREEEERRRKEEERRKDDEFRRVTGDVKSLKSQLKSLLACVLPRSPLPSHNEE
ncbi:hypothetical protein RND71_004614 [Anisodus tanguticus]|uniref:Uncharacterized protein n=1 Tax=Anisodus tanguticus TaxID=243964 RepID=A0AAE1SRA1_9SOLA|nr:hypothetical protein RND71_004614 [Anisodus tanguticus]